MKIIMNCEDLMKAKSVTGMKGNDIKRLQLFVKVRKITTTSHCFNLL